MPKEQIQFIDLKRQYEALRDEIDMGIAGVLQHGRFIAGPEVGDFELALSNFSGTPHVVSCASGTDALRVILMSMGVGCGDAVFLPSFTYTATAEAILVLGAEPVFVDVELRSFNIDPTKLEATVARVEADGRLRPRVIMAVDLFGMPADYAHLEAIAERKGISIIADAAQSLGAECGGKKAGGLAQVTATSFFPAKPLGCYGDGGAMFFMDKAQAEVARSICLHGRGSSKYDVVRIGVNSRLDTIQAAILLAKLPAFPEEIARRNWVARTYDAAFSGLVETPKLPAGTDAFAWAQYTIRVEPKRRSQILDALRSECIPTAVYYPAPMHLQPAYEAYGEGPGSLPVSERLCREVLSLPMHGHMHDGEVERVASAVRRATA